MIRRLPAVLQARPGDDEIALAPDSVARYRRRGLRAATLTASAVLLVSVALAVALAEPLLILQGLLFGLFLGAVGASLATSRLTWAVIRLQMTAVRGDRRRMRRLRRSLMRNRYADLPERDRDLALTWARVSHAGAAVAIVTLLPLALGLGGLQVLTLTEPDPPAWRTVAAIVFIAACVGITAVGAREQVGLRRFLASAAGQRRGSDPPGESDLRH